MREELMNLASKADFKSLLETRDLVPVNSSMCYFYYLCELQRWLRENKKILAFPYVNFQEKDYYYCSIFPFNGDRFSTKDYSTYEEALEQGLLEALKLIKS